MIKKIGILTKTLGTSQKSYFIIKNMNKLLKEKALVDIIVFYDTYSKQPLSPEFAIMQNNNIWGFDGTAIATDCESVSRALLSPSIPKVYFYVWDLEWLFYIKEYPEYQQVYQNERVDLIARSQDHYDILKKCWKEPIGIMKDFDNEHFTQLFSV